MFIKLRNKYFHCKLHLIAVIFHLYVFLNPPTLSVCINAFQTYISKFMMILLVYVLVRFQVIGQNLNQMQKRNLLSMNILLYIYAWYSFAIESSPVGRNFQRGVRRCESRTSRQGVPETLEYFEALQTFGKFCFSKLKNFEDFYQTLHQKIRTLKVKV